MNKAYREQFQSLPEYNGWTNRPTWLAKLHIDNEYNSYVYWSEVSQEILENSYSKAKAAYDLEDRLREEHMVGDSGLNGDLLSWAYAYVNWREIAEALIDEAEEALELEA